MILLTTLLYFIYNQLSCVCVCHWQLWKWLYKGKNRRVLEFVSRVETLSKKPNSWCWCHYGRCQSLCIVLVLFSFWTMNVWLPVIFVVRGTPEHSDLGVSIFLLSCFCPWCFLPALIHILQLIHPITVSMVMLHCLRVADEETHLVSKCQIVLSVLDCLIC